MFFNYFLSLCLLRAIIATPLSGKVSIDTSSHCGQQDVVTAGHYSLLLNHWGLAHATSGYGCAALASLRGTTIAWSTSWTWAGDSNIKSYTNIQLNKGLNKKLSAIKSMPATWSWSQTSKGTVVSNVAYDLVTSSSPGGNGLNEIMIWLANFNADAISLAYRSEGQGIPIARNIVLAGHAWDLYSGYNGANNVFSFLPSGGTTITSFSGNLDVFLKYMTAHQYISKEEFLKTAQGGSEATLGTATFTTLAYSLVII